MGLLEAGIEMIQVKCVEQALACGRCSANMSHDSDATSLSHVYTGKGAGTGTTCAFV